MKDGKWLKPLKNRVLFCARFILIFEFIFDIIKEKTKEVLYGKMVKGKGLGMV